MYKVIRVANLNKESGEMKPIKIVKEFSKSYQAALNCAARNNEMISNKTFGYEHVVFNAETQKISIPTL